MKKNRLKILRDIFVNFLGFFLMCGFVVSCSVMLFMKFIDYSEAEIRVAAPYTFFNVLVLTVLFVAFDVVRRKITVERPTKKIRNALDEITKGDFDVRLDSSFAEGNFAEIMESINSMTEELSGVETLRNDFISNVSHELKTPLAVIQNYASLLQDENLTEEKRREYSKTIVYTSKKLSDLITNILKLNKLENQQIFPESEEYILSEQICESVIQFEEIWERKNIEIKTNLDEDLRIRADKELLSIVWNNLLSNAFKFTDENDCVSITLKEENGFAVVTVSDTGCGMTPEIGTHIFEKFYQGDTSRTTSGNGLGLALVKRIIDIVDGEISVKSTFGEGSEFSVKLKL